MSRKVGLFSVAAIMLGIFITQAVSQENQPPERRRPAGEPGQFRQRMMERIHNELKASDEEWKTLEPKIAKVLDLQNQMRSGMRQMGPRPQGPDAAPPTSNIEKKAAELRKLLDDPNAKPDVVKAALKDLRDARAETKAELTVAQKDLAKAVNPHQEAYLVLIGVLD
jgi:hypothetical protein